MNELEALKKFGKKIDLGTTKCKKCKGDLDLRVTTELPKTEEKTKEPKVLMFYGYCHKCNVLYMLRLIPFKEIPLIYDKK